MAHVPVIRRSMRPDEWTKIRVGWLKNRMISESVEIEGWQIREGYQTGEMSYALYDETPRALHKGDLYFTPDGTAFLSVVARLPEGWESREDVRLRLTTAAEMIVKINGEYAGGIDPNRETLKLPKSINGEYVIEIEGYNRSKPDDDRSVETRRLKGCRQVFQGGQFVCVDREIQALYYDVSVFYDILSGGQFGEDVCRLISDRLYKALSMIDWDEDTGYSEAREFIQKELYENRLYGAEGDVALVAHSHLDIAYYWRRVHSVQKNARTCLIQLKMMEDYPELVYTHTQAFLYESLERNYPEIFDAVARKIREGQFEPVGGMYVESDCNVPNAESLTRQFLYGQRYFREKFGKICLNCWLPDVFGNSAVLPQILKKSGIRYFVSNKMSTWNDTNRFPHNHFIWRGLDGSEVYACVPPTHFITACTPTEIMANWAAYQDKDSGGQTLCMFGYGDGGSGVTEDMMEFRKRLNRISCMPKTEIMGGEAFLERNLNADQRLKTWDGELYLEMHRGTFTTKAALKKQNRRLETLLRDAEMACALRWAAGGDYPAEKLTALWKKLLVNQFHDILPGSNIHPVFEDAMKDYAEIEADARRLLGAAGDRYFNSLNFDRSGPQKVEENGQIRWAYAEIPALSAGEIEKRANSVSSIKCEEMPDGIRVKTRFLTALVCADGSISSIQDADGREYTDGAFNRLCLFEDIPGNYDAWDILPTYREKPLPIETEEPIRLKASDGGTLTLECVLNTEKSRWAREIRFFENANQIEVTNRVSWNETHVLAKAEFSCAVCAPYALCDTSAGFVTRETNRNTTWQQARYEVCQHKWCDLSETDSGVAIINDGKYGVGLWDNVISLSLLRAPCRPDPVADRGEHEFSYLIVPHSGSAVEAQINRRALMYNTPLLPVSLPSFRLPEAPSMHVQAIKRGEDGNLLVVRLSEQDGKRGVLRFPCPVKVLNLLEDEQGETTDAAYKPFEILTIGIKPENLCYFMNREA